MEELSTAQIFMILVLLLPTITLMSIMIACFHTYRENRQINKIMDEMRELSKKGIVYNDRD